MSSAPREKPSPPLIPPNRGVLPRHALGFFPRLRDDAEHPRAWEWPAYLDQPACAWLMALKELYATPWAFPASLAPEAGLMLFALVRNIRPRRAIEIGSFIGVSTIWMGAAMKEGGASREDRPGGAGYPSKQVPVLHAFDDFGPMAPGPWRDEGIEDRLGLFKRSIARAGLEGVVSIHPGDSSTEVRNLHALLRPSEEAVRAAWGQPITDWPGGVDLALIDGNHTVEGVFRDLAAVEPVLNTGGYIILHDTIPEQCGDHQGPRHVIDHIREVAQGVYELCELHTAPLNYGMALLRRVG
ncbi:MAG: O-methyltransferase [Phycisphaerales bacterium]